MKAGRYCSAIFLDVSQAFEKIWHRGLLYKIKNRFPINLYVIIKSYLLHRTFTVKYGGMIIQNDQTGCLKHNFEFLKNENTFL